jgi:hypothetical protein
MPKIPKKQVISKPHPGTKPDILKIEENWENAVKTYFGQKNRLEDGQSAYDLFIIMYS